MEEKLAQARLATAQASDSASEKEWWITELRRRGAETLLEHIFSPDRNFFESKILDEHALSSSEIAKYLSGGEISYPDLVSPNQKKYGADFSVFGLPIDLTSEEIQERLLNLYSVYGEDFL